MTHSQAVAMAEEFSASRPRQVEAKQRQVDGGTRMNEILEEGDNCPMVDCTGRMEYIRQDDCSCHISPPCNVCVDAPLQCPVCGFIPEDRP